MVLGDVATLRATDASVPLVKVSHPSEALTHFPTALPVLDIPIDAPVRPGRPSVSAAPQIIAWIERGVALALAGEVAGLVTAPIAKAPLYEAGFAFPGHTEFLGELTKAAPQPGARGPIMMLAVEGLRTTLVTVHTPLAQVSAALTQDKILLAAQVTAQSLTRDFGIVAPRIAIAGLNPHAGETGGIGREEIEIIAPAVATLRAQGLNVTGPHPADSLFHAEARARFDAVVCMYHDQALIPVKMLDFWGGVNITLGLPIVRTSPDHGTAFDIAGQGIARPDSLIAAILAARDIAACRAR
jgi:4-hydroxythreonine-4-phosphate dehydrogenase